MIWVAGQIVRDDALSVSVLDRTFEHGLGLFETFRTWNGHATLLPRHLERLNGAAADLGLPVPEAWQLPTEKDVHDLLKADGRVGDAMLRITMSGGVAGSPTGAMVWMRSFHLPPEKAEGYVITATWKVAARDRYGSSSQDLRRYKTLNYWERRRVHELALNDGLDENLAIDENGSIYEGSRTNVFVITGDHVSTPHGDGRIVPGIMRNLVLQLATEAGLTCSEVNSPLVFDRFSFGSADEVFLTNSVRGILPVAGFRHDYGTEWEYTPDWTKRFPAPGPRTVRLWHTVRSWLESGGEHPQ